MGRAGTIGGHVARSMGRPPGLVIGTGRARSGGPFGPSPPRGANGTWCCWKPGTPCPPLPPGRGS